MIASVVPESRQVLEEWYNNITGDEDGEFVRLTSIVSALAAVQVVPRQDTFLGVSGLSQ